MSGGSPWSAFAGLETGPDGEGSLRNVYPTETQVSMCGATRIVPVRLREAEEGEEETHWGWLEPDREPSMIYPSRVQLGMCFPYGIEAEIRAGRGREVRLVVEVADPDRDEGVG